MRFPIYKFLMFLCIGFLSFYANGQTTNSPDFVSENFNHTSSTVYDITGKVIVKSRSYFDDFGKQTQSQSWDVKTKKVWATQTEYDEQGRPVLNTFSAPIGGNLRYSNGFLEDPSGNTFRGSDFGSIDSDPSTVGTAPNTVGIYYSSKNTSEPYQDITARPYSRTFYDELNPGNVLKTVGGNKVDTDGDGTPDSFPQGFSYTMPAAQELYYAYGKETFLEMTNTTEDYVITDLVQKTVTIDAHGEEVVSFSNNNDQLLATARSGNTAIAERRVMSLIGPKGYVDIHIPKGCGENVYFLEGITNYKVFDLKTSEELAISSIEANGAFHILPVGIYRIQTINTNIENLTNALRLDSGLSLLNQNSRGVVYSINYYDYSLNYYDNAGNLKSSLPPIGFNNEAHDLYQFNERVTHINESLMSYYEYDSLGNLIYTKSPDQGEAWFKYRTDGQIRFSQNELQKNEGKFSYTNYDHEGRAVESGVYTKAPEGAFDTNESPLDAILDDTNTIEEYIDGKDNYLENFYCYEQYFTVYDTPDPEGLTEAFGNDDRVDNYRHQSFVNGYVSKSYTYNSLRSSTWYSYDVYGRVKWMAQQLFIQSSFTGVKTIDYEYDDITGLINKVYFQKGVPGEEFIHKYTYDPDDNSLMKVETATNDAGPYTVHADYEYYENGALKRTELAQGLQGIDYVYNLNGALKAINHPSLDASKDPGKDANDIFGMMVNYYDGDYNRSGVHLNSNNIGENQYNGNIKAIHWNNKAVDSNTSDEKSYVYQYNRNNWLTEAEFNQGEGGDIKVQALVIKENDTISNNVTASEEIRLNEGVDIIGTSDLITLSISDAIQEVGTDDYKVSSITYDANGNIQSLKRNKNTESGSNQMDDMIYHYNESRPNQLSYVEDKVTTTTNANDIKSQDKQNYVYNEIGQLIYNNIEEVEYVYNTRGLVSEVKKDGNVLVRFIYNSRGQRIKKESYNPVNRNLQYVEVYVRDTDGTPMAIYRDGQVAEHTVYGSGRLGVYKRANNNTTYELTDHLGNVRALVEKEERIKGGTDYYPFGMPMPLRNSLSDYRYAYQGQEKDTETGKEAFELRLWDARIGRWLTTDPAGQYASPYLGMGNNPISRVDPDGGTDGTIHNDNGLDDISFDNSFIEGNFRFQNTYSSSGVNGTANGAYLQSVNLEYDFLFTENTIAFDFAKIEFTKDNYGNGSLNGSLVNLDFGAKAGDDFLGSQINLKLNIFNFELTKPYGNFLRGEYGRYGAQAGFSLGGSFIKGGISGKSTLALIDIENSISGTIGSAHIGYEFSTFYDDKTKKIHFNNMGHIGLLFGVKFKGNIAVPAQFFQSPPPSYASHLNGIR